MTQTQGREPASLAVAPPLRASSESQTLGRRTWLKQSLCSASVASTAWMGAASMAQEAKAASSRREASPSPVMSRGLNLSHWFEYERGQAVTRGELSAMTALGFDHIRLPVDPIVCGWRPVAGKAFPAMAALSKAMDDAVQAGLEVVLDLHFEPADKKAIETSAEAQRAVVDLWSSFAHEWSAWPVRRVAFELFNEPQFYGSAASQWPGFQQQMLEAVRVHAPGHTVLVTGQHGSSVEGLQRLKPLRDARLVYVFHYYLPYLFTHQGAHWMDTRYTTAGLHKGVRYPTSEQAGHRVQLSKPHPRADRELAEYLEQDWGPQRIKRELSQAGAWARRNDVRVVCNEFGVLRAAADAQSRYRWIGDVRQALEAQGIGWTLWDYTDIFGITAESALLGKAGSRRFESQALAALGRDRGAARAGAER